MIDDTPNLDTPAEELVPDVPEDDADGLIPGADSDGYVNDDQENDPAMEGDSGNG